MKVHVNVDLRMRIQPDDWSPVADVYAAGILDLRGGTG
jgi:hypothetical protein